MENLEEEPKRGVWKSLSWFFVLVVSLLLIAYWVVPFNSTDFGSASGNSNFSLDGLNSEMQFYENMRFPEPKISYYVYDCPLQKTNDMEQAFEILTNETILEFNKVNSDQEISITCDSRTKLEEGLFIAGEGGPTNITKTSDFNVILGGKILLIRDSNCGTPNVALHELLHVLGFDHSSNKQNIMYNISGCGQTIGDDIINLINEIYSIESLSDLTLENVSATMNGKYLNTNISIRNNGLKDSEDFKVNIYADEKLVKNVDMDGLKIGYGTSVMLSNLLIKQISVDELVFEIEYLFDELDKLDNKIVLAQ